MHNPSGNYQLHLQRLVFMVCGICLPLNGVWGGTDDRRTVQGSVYAGISCHSLPSVTESTKDRNFSCQVEEPGSFLPDQDSDRFDREHMHRELEALGRQDYDYRERKSRLARCEPALSQLQVVGDSSAERSDLPL
jgi:hypothetical protein